MAKTEAREIAEMMPGAQVFTGKNATKKAFMSAIENAQIVHFAGHYVADPEIRRRVPNLFLPQAEEDGGLRISDISGEKNAESKLVVLSACETGIENVMRGEG